MRTIVILLLFALCSCSSAWHLKQAEKHIRKAQIKGGTWSADTVYLKDTVFVNAIRVDSIVTIKQGDSMVIHKDRLQVIIRRLKGDSIFVTGECEADTIIRKVPVTVIREIKAKGGIGWQWLLVAFFLGMFALLAIRR